MFLSAPPTKENAVSLVHDAVQHLLCFLRKSDCYTWDGKHAPAVTISFSASRRMSRGSSRGVSFALNHWMKDGDIYFGEYKSFRNDPDIGEVTGPWSLIVAIVVAHEVAHWAQFSTHVQKIRGVDYSKPHGEGFKDIYRFLRAEIISWINSQ